MNPSEDECVAVPDPASMRVLSWDPRVVFFNADLLYGGTEPFANCPRSILKSVTQRAASLGCRFMLGVETEFYVFRRDGLPDLVPIAPSSSLFPTPAYDVESTLDSLDFLAEVARHLAAADFGLFSFDHEGGNGQYELDCAHAEALELCDRLVYLRLLLRHVAGRQGCFVTFMPKPMRTLWGSGAHMNMSLESLDGTNLFLEPRDDGRRVWTAQARSFVAGVLRHAPALSALTCPTVNSYKRLVPHLADGSVSWAPVWATYGDNNRSCMLRLPANRPAIENRAVDMTANMYLAAAFTLAAGLEGIELDLDPGEPVPDNTSSWDSRRRAQGTSAAAHAARSDRRVRRGRARPRHLPAPLRRRLPGDEASGVGGVPRRRLALGGRPLPVQRLRRNTMRVLYVNPMQGEVNPAIDAIAYGLQHSLDKAGIDVRMLLADFRDPQCAARTADAIHAGIDAGVDGIAYYALDPTEPAAAVAAARAAGIPVFTFVRPYFPVNSALLYPNFNHGVCMAEWLSERLAAGARVAIIGGPDTPDDAEEVAGLLYAFRRRGVEVANDPTDPHVVQPDRRRLRRRGGHAPPARAVRSPRRPRAVQRRDDARRARRLRQGRPSRRA